MLPSVDVRSCPVCAHTRSWRFQRFRHQDVDLSYRVCRSCGLVFMSPRFSDHDLAEFYKRDYRLSYSGSEGQTAENVDIQTARGRHLAEFVHEHVASANRILDIGCSTGQLLMAIRKELGATTAVGVEPSNAHRGTAATRDITAYPSVEALCEQQPAPFDVISMSHVLEHIAEPAQLLELLRSRLLGEHGTLLLEVPNVYGSESYEIAHLLCFSPETLQLLLERSGFEIIAQRIHSVPRHPRGKSYVTVLARRAPPRDRLSELATPPWRVHLQRGLGLTNWTIAHLIGERATARLRRLRRFGRA